MSVLLALLTYDREDLMVAALAALAVAGAAVAIGAWLLLFREVRRKKRLPTEEPRPADVQEGPRPADVIPGSHTGDVSEEDRTYS
jgi:hypothetical protein